MSSNTKKNWSIGTLAMQVILSLTIMMGMNTLAMAQTQDKSSSFNVSTYLTAQGQEQKYFKTGNPIGSFIVQIVNFLVLTIGSVSFVALVVGGFTLMTSHGNENQLTKGKDIIKYALAGLVIVLTAYFITAFVQSLFYELPPTS